LTNDYLLLTLQFAGSNAV